MIGTRIGCRLGYGCHPASLAETIAHVAQHVVDGGASALAERVWARLQDPRPLDTFRRWFLKVCSPHETTYRLPVDLVGPFCRAAQDDTLIAELARDAGGVFIRVPETRGDASEILQAHLVAVRQFGAEADQLAAMLADGIVTADEIPPFEQALDAAVAALVALKPVVRAHVRPAAQGVAV